MSDGINIAYHGHTVERLTAENARLRAALRELIPFTAQNIEGAYRDADVPIVMDDPVMKQARAALEGLTDDAP